MSNKKLDGKKVWVAGHKGMVGSSIVRALEKKDCEIITCDIDLREQQSVRDWFKKELPEMVFLAAAKVGGIGANAAKPAQFYYDNAMIANNVLHEAYLHKVEKLLFLGSSCIYPKFAQQPIKEGELLTGALEPTNEAYAIAKIAGLKMCEFYRSEYGCDFISAMPCNLYGEGDKYDLEQAHVIPSLIMKMHIAKMEHKKSVKLWGTGKPLREFLYVDDLVSALCILMEEYSAARHVNVGSNQEVSIFDLAKMVAQVVGFKGDIVFDSEKPDGTPRKIMNSDEVHALGWKPRVNMQEGLEKAYADFLKRDMM